MATETELVDLLHAIGDQAPDPDHTLDVLSPRLRAAVPAHRARRVLAVAATVVAVAGVGVGSTVVLQSADTNTAAGYVDADPTTNHETYELPLDRYAASDTQWKTLQHASDVLQGRCAQAKGVAPLELRVASRGTAARTFLTRVADDVRPLTLAQARSFAYDLYPNGSAALDGVGVGEVSKAQARVWRPCGEAATRTLLHGAKPAVSPEQLGTEIQPDLFDDDLRVRDVYVAEARSNSTTPAVTHAQARWSACMAEHGYGGLHSTVDAIVRQRGSASAAAKRQAVQDVKCKEATGFMTVWVEALREAQRAVISKHRDALTGFEKRLKIRLANAARVLDQP